MPHVRAGAVCVSECKQDLIDKGAIAQLGKYHDALLADWTTLEKRVAEYCGRELHLTKEAPVLVAIGYRCEAVAGGASVEKLAFKYPGRSFNRFVDSQSAGSVCLATANDSGHPSEPHPEVLKTRYAERHLAGLPIEVRRRFWHIDGLMRKVDGVRPHYAGKKAQNFASYRRKRRVCITGTIEGDSIVWCIIGRKSASLLMEMGVETDADEMFETLQRAAFAVPNAALHPTAAED